MSLVKCKVCGNKVSKKAATCPQCGAPQKVKKKTSLFTWLIVVSIGSYMFSTIIADQESAKQKQAQEKRNVQFLEEFKSNKKAIIIELNQLLEQENYTEITSQASKYKNVRDKDLLVIVNQAKEKILLSEALSIPAADAKKNLDIYKNLSLLAPNNQMYQDKIEHYQAKLDRTKLIEKQFSSWDGSHIQLEKVIKQQMKNPDSYEHVETLYWDRGDHITVQTTYRGTNSFNAVVTETKRIELNLDGTTYTEK